MSSNHITYIDSFKKYEPSLLKTNALFSNLASYSTFINGKANEIFSMAAADSSVDSLQLQKEIIELGIIYIKLFVAMSKEKQTSV